MNTIKMMCVMVMGTMVLGCLSQQAHERAIEELEMTHQNSAQELERLKQVVQEKEGTVAQLEEILDGKDKTVAQLEGGIG